MAANLRNSLVLAISVLFCLGASSYLFAAEESAVMDQKTYVFHTAMGSPVKEILRSRLQEAFRRLNLKVKLIVNHSSQRALMLANEEGDGDAARVPNLKEIAPQNADNLIRVPEVIISMELAVYTNNMLFPVRGWSSLAKYHNGARVGAKILEKNIPGERTFLPTTVQLVKMLDAKRIETLVEWNIIADNAIRNLAVSGITKLSPPIKTQPFYVYLHKKNRALVPKLSAVLRQMQEDGYFARINNEYVFYTGAQSPGKEILERRLQEAFLRAGGLKVKLVYTGSAQRALVQANEYGDGDAARVPNIKKIAPNETSNLMQIPESINNIKFYVYTKGAVSVVDGYKSLANFRNGFRLGAKILEKNIPGERVMLPDATRLLQMLNDGRLDTVVEWASIADKIIKENGYSGITRLYPPLLNLPTYSLINQKNQALVPALSKALKEMKVDGTFENIEKEVLTRFNLN